MICHHLKHPPHSCLLYLSTVIDQSSILITRHGLINDYFCCVGQMVCFYATVVTKFQRARGLIYCYPFSVLIKRHGLTLTTPKSSKGHFLEKFSTVGKWYFHLFKWGKTSTWQDVQAISAEYKRSTEIHGAF